MNFDTLIEKLNPEKGTETFRALVERNPEKMKQFFVSLLNQKRNLEELTELQQKQIAGGNKIIELLKKEIVGLKKKTK